MGNLTIVTTKNAWEEAAALFSTLDVYDSFEYGSLFAEQEGGELRAAFYEDEGVRVFYPFIVRAVDDGYWDCVTPYGYGGPRVEPVTAVADGYFAAFHRYCQEERIVTETIRFHPLAGNVKQCEGLPVSYVRQTAAVDLTRELEEIRASYSSMCRRNLKAGVKKGVVCRVVEHTAENVGVFREMYEETMDRNGAGSYYYFDRGYFEGQLMRTGLSETVLVFAFVGDEVIAGVMMLMGREFAHYHLGASRTEGLSLRPNNVLFDFMVEYARGCGKRFLHLGGGCAEGDRLFQFKVSFGAEVFEYWLGKVVHDEVGYEELVRRYEAGYVVSEEYFPRYRGGVLREAEVVEGRGA